MLDVMLVEDEVHFAQRLAETIGRTDSMRIVASVGTVREAIATLQTALPDLLLVDLGLPDGSGIEVIKTAVARGLDCEILVITVFGDLDNVLQSIEAGATGYFVKGDPNDDCLRRIQELQAGGSPVSPIIARELLSRFQMDRERTSVKQDQESVPMSKRERETLDLLARGFNYREIADLLDVTENTIRTHVKSIYRKLQVNSRGEAVFEARQLGILG